MERLRILNNLRDIEELGQEAVTASVACTCGSNLFSIKHSGKQTRGILASYLVKKNHQLVVKAICKACGEEVIIYDSKLDGTHRNLDDSNDTSFSTFQLPKAKSQFYQIKMMYNYFPDNFKENDVLTNDFEAIFVDISNEEVKKAYRIIEE